MLFRSAYKAFVLFLYKDDGKDFDLLYERYDYLKKKSHPDFNHRYDAIMDAAKAAYDQQYDKALAIIRNGGTNADSALSVVRVYALAGDMKNCYGAMRRMYNDLDDGQREDAGGDEGRDPDPDAEHGEQRAGDRDRPDGGQGGLPARRVDALPAGDRDQRQLGGELYADRKGGQRGQRDGAATVHEDPGAAFCTGGRPGRTGSGSRGDRKSTRLNSSHQV